MPWPNGCCSSGGRSPSESAAANGVAFAVNVAVFSIVFFTALYLQLIAGYSGWRIAAAFVAVAVGVVAGAPLAGRWTARDGPRRPLAAGCLLAGGGVIAVEWTLSPRVSLPALAWPLALAGLGLGLALVTMNAAVLTLVPPARSGTAASTVNTSRELGGVFGVAVLGAIVNAQLTGGLAAKLQALGIPANFRAIVIDAVTHGGLPSAPAAAGNPAAHGHETLVAQVIAAAQHAAGRGIHEALLVAAGVVFAAGAGAVVAATRTTPTAGAGR